MTSKKNEYNCQDLSSLGSELVFTQDKDGNYYSFFWQPIYDGSDNSDLDKPRAVPFEAYLARIRRVLVRRIPERCYCCFNYGGEDLFFELVISPILRNGQDSDLVLVMGSRLQSQELPFASGSALPTNPDPYQKVLTNIARNIRRTLDLETIWQQTVNAIGGELSVNRCILAIPSGSGDFFDVKAEFCEEPYGCLLGSRFSLSEHPCLQAVCSSKIPFVSHDDIYNQYQAKSILVVGTFYQKELNGVIALHQCDRTRYWSEAELELVKELADQVGTAIAHATIYKKLEEANIEAEEASRLKSEFLASTSHELRTPLNGILGFLQLVLDGMADNEEEEREFIGQAYKSARHLLNLINDILDIAKIEANKIEFEITPISLNKICEDFAKFAYSQAEKKHLDFNINLPSTYDSILIFCDYRRLLQVMLNLVGNSLKFTQEGEISIDVEIIAKPLEYNGEELPGVVKIVIADTGIGVSLEKQQKLFEKFYQVDGSRTKAYGGTGLGLAISQRLVEAMGGKISFYSMGEGLGSTVTLTVPLSQLPIIRN